MAGVGGVRPIRFRVCSMVLLKTIFESTNHPILVLVEPGLFASMVYGKTLPPAHLSLYLSDGYCSMPAIA